MIFDAEVFRWHPNGMTTNPFVSGETYVTVRDAERMLEAAHKRGYEQGHANGSQPLVERIHSDL